MSWDLGMAPFKKFRMTKPAPSLSVSRISPRSAASRLSSASRSRSLNTPKPFVSTTVASTACLRAFLS